MRRWMGVCISVGLVVAMPAMSFAGGALQVLTFPFTWFDIPLPEGGVGWDQSYSR